MSIGLVWVSLTGCGLFGSDPTTPTETESPDEDSGGGPGDPTPPGPEFSVVSIVAQLRYEALTALPGEWTDEEGTEGRNLIGIIVGDDTYTGFNGTACVIEIPVDPADARLITELDANQFWGIDLTVDPKSVTTNCTDPQYQTISSLYGGNVVEFFLQNRDGTPAEFGILLEEPLPSTTAWVEDQRIDVPEEEIIGGTILLSDRFPQAKSEQFLVTGVEVDAKGQVQVAPDKKTKQDEPIPIPLDDVFQNPGVKEGVYDFFGYRLFPFTP